MVKSMTGYGKAECSAAGKNVTIEIRALNSKSLDVNLKLPSLYREKESLIRNELSRVVQRGKVDFGIQTEAAQETATTRINEVLFKAYYEELSRIARETGIAVEDGNILACILRMPDVLTTSATTLDEQEWDVFFKCLQEALTAFDNFRTTEGEVLRNEILQRVNIIEQLLESVIPFEKQRIETVRQRIENSLKEISTAFGYDRNRFEQEMIYYLEKLDITEEKVRLKQHCTHFASTMKEESPGRKLGFIAQEMGREINTLGSKANYADIQQVVVQMKDELEKIKEQLLNLL